MKKNIHPSYQIIDIVCITCNNKFKIGSTSKKISIDVCSSCHPFYTGSTSSMKSTGRVERFNRMFKNTNTK